MKKEFEAELLDMADLVAEMRDDLARIVEANKILVEALGDMRDNYDCDHRSRTPCLVCCASEVLGRVGKL